MNPPEKPTLLWKLEQVAASRFVVDAVVGLLKGISVDVFQLHVDTRMEMKIRSRP